MKKNKAVEAGEGSLKDYFAEAKIWDEDKTATIKKSKSQAWMVAGFGMVVGILGMASATMQAMKDPAPPVVLRVDNSTGVVDVATTLTDAKTNYEEVVNKFFVQRYVRFREGYSSALAQEYYKSVGLMSSAKEQQKFAEEFARKNPNSPLNLYGQSAQAKTKVKSTSFISPTTALVRYIKCIERGGEKPRVTHWAATIEFGYSALPMKEKDREINPLGYQTKDWRKDPDSVNDTDSEESCSDDRRSAQGQGQA